MKNDRKNENQIQETQVIQKLTDPSFYEDESENHMSDTQVIQKMTDVDTDYKKTETSEEGEEKKKSAFSEVISFIRDLAICMVIALLVTNFIISPVRVSGRSMYPTLEDSSIGFSNILGFKLGHLNRFDIAIIYIPEKNEYLVKRVIGLPGDTVSYTNGQLYIDEEPVEESFLDGSYKAQYGDHFMTDVEPITLGDDEYYCLGDNRPHSTDSRFYGPFKKENIRSKGIFILYPFSNAGAETW